MAKGNIQTYKVGKVTVVVDRSKCISCATCTIIAPEIFELDEDLICRVKESPKSDNVKLIKEAVDNCASEALKILEN